MISLKDKLNQYRKNAEMVNHKDESTQSTISYVQKQSHSELLKILLDHMGIAIALVITPLSRASDFLQSTKLYCYLDKYSFVVKMSCWFLLWFAAIFAEFGLVFLIISLIAFMFLNTSTRKKSEGEPSAYSVFNENCERIKGTLTAEQLEKQLVYGTLS